MATQSNSLSVDDLPSPEQLKPLSVDDLPSPEQLTANDHYPTKDEYSGFGSLGRLGKATKEYAKSRMDASPTGFFEPLVGAGEVALSGITGLGHAAYAGYKGLGAGIGANLAARTQGAGFEGAAQAARDASTEAIRGVSSEGTYEPKTASGKYLTALGNAALEVPAEYLGKGGKLLGSVIGPQTAVALESLGEAAPQIAAALLGLKGVNGGRVAHTPADIKMKQDLFLRGRDIGLKAIPTEINPSTAHGVLESVNKAAKVADELSRQNAESRARAIRKDFPQLDAGLKQLKQEEVAPGEIHPDELYAVIEDEGKKYDTLRETVPIVKPQGKISSQINGLVNKISRIKEKYPNLSSGPTEENLAKMASDVTSKSEMAIDDVLENIRDLRKDAKSHLSSPAGKEIGVMDEKMGKFKFELAGLLEDAIDANLPENSQALLNFRTARSQIAKAYDVLAALNPATGEVRGQKLAQLFNSADKRDVLTGNLRTVAEHAAAFKKVHKDISSMSGNTPLNPWDFILAGGALSTGHYGLAAGEIASRIGASRMLGSDYLQNKMASKLTKPQVNTGTPASSQLPIPPTKGLELAPRGIPLQTPAASVAPTTRDILSLAPKGEPIPMTGARPATPSMPAANWDIENKPTVTAPEPPSKLTLAHPEGIPYNTAAETIPPTTRGVLSLAPKGEPIPMRKATGGVTNTSIPEEDWGKPTLKEIGVTPTRTKTAQIENDKLKTIAEKEKHAVDNGYTLKVYRGVERDKPFNDTSTVWGTTSKEVAEAYASEVHGYEHPHVITMMVNPNKLKTTDLRKASDEVLDSFTYNSFESPQDVGIYKNSDDSPLGSAYSHTVVHVPKANVIVLKDTP